MKPHATGPDASWPRDAHLAQALQHAPEPDQVPAASVREAVLAQARSRLGRAAAAPSASWWTRWWGDQIRWAGAAASVLVMVLAGVLWGSRERREEMLEVASAPVMPSPAAAPAAPVAAASKVPDRRVEPEVRSKASPRAVAPTAPPMTQVAQAASDSAIATAGTGMRTELALAPASSAPPMPKLMAAPARAELARARSTMPAASCQWEPEVLPCDAVAVQALLGSAVWQSVQARAAVSVHSAPQASWPRVRWTGELPAGRVHLLAWVADQRLLWWQADGSAQQVVLTEEAAAAWQPLWDAVRAPLSDERRSATD